MDDSGEDGRSGADEAGDVLAEAIAMAASSPRQTPRLTPAHAPARSPHARAAAEGATAAEADASPPARAGEGARDGAQAVADSDSGAGDVVGELPFSSPPGTVASPDAASERAGRGGRTPQSRPSSSSSGSSPAMRNAASTSDDRSQPLHIGVTVSRRNADFDAFLRQQEAADGGAQEMKASHGGSMSPEQRTPPTAKRTLLSRLSRFARASSSPKSSRSRRKPPLTPHTRARRHWGAVADSLKVEGTLARVIRAARSPIGPKHLAICLATLVSVALVAFVSLIAWNVAVTDAYDNALRVTAQAKSAVIANTLADADQAAVSVLELWDLTLGTSLASVAAAVGSEGAPVPDFVVLIAQQLQASRAVGGLASAVAIADSEGNYVAVRAAAARDAFTVAAGWCGVQRGLRVDHRDSDASFDHRLGQAGYEWAGGAVAVDETKCPTLEASTTRWFERAVEGERWMGVDAAPDDGGDLSYHVSRRKGRPDGSHAVASAVISQLALQAELEAWHAAAVANWGSLSAEGYAGEGLNAAQREHVGQWLPPSLFVLASASRQLQVQQGHYGDDTAAALWDAVEASGARPAGRDEYLVHTSLAAACTANRKFLEGVDACADSISVIVEPVAMTRTATSAESDHLVLLLAVPASGFLPERWASVTLSAVLVGIVLLQLLATQCVSKIRASYSEAEIATCYDCGILDLLTPERMHNIVRTTAVCFVVLTYVVWQFPSDNALATAAADVATASFEAVDTRLSAASTSVEASVVGHAVQLVNNASSHAFELAGAAAWAQLLARQLASAPASVYGGTYVAVTFDGGDGYAAALDADGHAYAQAQSGAALTTLSLGAEGEFGEVAAAATPFAGRPSLAEWHELLVSHAETAGVSVSPADGATLSPLVHLGVPHNPLSGVQAAGMTMAMQLVSRTPTATAHARGIVSGELSFAAIGVAIEAMGTSDNAEGVAYVALGSTVGPLLAQRPGRDAIVQSRTGERLLADLSGEESVRSLALAFHSSNETADEQLGASSVGLRRYFVDNWWSRSSRLRSLANASSAAAAEHAAVIGTGLLSSAFDTIGVPSDWNAVAFQVAIIAVVGAALAIDRALRLAHTWEEWQQKRRLRATRAVLSKQQSQRKRRASRLGMRDMMLVANASRRPTGKPLRPLINPHISRVDAVGPFKMLCEFLYVDSAVYGHAMDVYNKGWSFLSSKGRRSNTSSRSPAADPLSEVSNAATAVVDEGSDGGTPRSVTPAEPARRRSLTHHPGAEGHGKSWVDGSADGTLDARVWRAAAFLVDVQDGRYSAEHWDPAFSHRRRLYVLERLADLALTGHNLVRQLHVILTDHNRFYLRLMLEGIISHRAVKAFSYCLYLAHMALAIAEADGDADAPREVYDSILIAETAIVSIYMIELAAYWLVYGFRSAGSHRSFFDVAELRSMQLDPMRYKETEFALLGSARKRATGLLQSILVAAVAVDLVCRWTLRYRVGMFRASLLPLTALLRPLLVVVRVRQIRRAVYNFVATTYHARQVFVLALVFVTVGASVCVALLGDDPALNTGNARGFSTLPFSVLTLFVFSATAENFPSVYWPAGNRSAWYFVFLNVFSLLGVFLFLSLLISFFQNFYARAFDATVSAEQEKSVLKRRAGLTVVFRLLQTMSMERERRRERRQLREARAAALQSGSFTDHSAPVSRVHSSSDLDGSDAEGGRGDDSPKGASTPKTTASMWSTRQAAKKKSSFLRPRGGGLIDSLRQAVTATVESQLETTMPLSHFYSFFTYCGVSKHELKELKASERSRFLTFRADTKQTARRINQDLVSGAGCDSGFIQRVKEYLERLELMHSRARDDLVVSADVVQFIIHAEKLLLPRVAGGVTLGAVRAAGATSFDFGSGFGFVTGVGYVYGRHGEHAGAGGAMSPRNGGAAAGLRAWNSGPGSSASFVDDMDESFAAVHKKSSCLCMRKLLLRPRVRRLGATVRKVVDDKTWFPMEACTLLLLVTYVSAAAMLATTLRPEVIPVVLGLMFVLAFDVVLRLFAEMQYNVMMRRPWGQLWQFERIAHSGPNTSTPEADTSHNVGALRFDIIVMAASVVGLVVSRLVTWRGRIHADDPALVVLLVPLVRLFSAVPATRRLVFGILASLPSFLPVLMLLLLFLYNYAVVGVWWFGGLSERLPSDDADTEYIKSSANFDSFASAIATLFQLFTGEDWDAVMYAAVDTAGTIVPIYYFLSYVFGVLLLFTNALIGIVVDK